jgi:galactose mutarotase-like enzyme
LFVAARPDQFGHVGHRGSVRSAAMASSASPTPAARIGTWRGEAAVTLAAGDLEATFLPSLSMLGVSLRHRGDELLAPIKPLAQYRAGRVTGIPFLYPWANRLGARTYRVARKRVVVPNGVPTDPNGLPIHGTVAGLPFDVVRIDGARLVAALDNERHRRITTAFPFAQRVELDVALDGTTLTVTTTVHAYGTTPSPVSFGFHPYFRVPGAPRAVTTLRLPPRDHVGLDDLQLPDATQPPAHEPADDQPIARRTFDDHYALGRDRRFALATNKRTLTISFDRGFPYAQIYAPPRAEFVCVEPMVATVNALVAAAAPMVEPGGLYRATWSVTIATR